MAHRRAITDHIHPFEAILSVRAADIEFELRGHGSMPWADYLLNPRRLRGSDFLMRWSQGRWSEERIIQAVNETNQYFALAYGPSGTAPDNDVRAYELYFERLEAAGLGRLKRPDLLIFQKSDQTFVDDIVQQFGESRSCLLLQKSIPGYRTYWHEQLSQSSVRIVYGAPSKCPIMGRR